MADGTTAPEDALLELKEAPFEDLGYAKVDFHRSVRQGAAEVIYGAGKTPEQIAGIVSAMGERGCRNILITRGLPGGGGPGGAVGPPGVPPDATAGRGLPGRAGSGCGNIVVATGGTSDMPVAEEAALTAEAMGNRVTRLYDVGVAGLHRLLSNLDVLMRARCVIAVAGMEGALASRRRRAGGLPGDRRPHQRGLWGQLRRPVRTAVHAQLLRLRVQRGEHRQRLRRRVPGQPDQSDGRFGGLRK